LESVVKRADIVIGAVGKPEFIKGAWIKDGTVGRRRRLPSARCRRYRTAGSDRPLRRLHADAGRSGPMTIATLITQTVETAEQAWGVAAA